MSQELIKQQQIDFESWISTTKYKGMDGIWRPELERYTAMTIKQMLWETWRASKAIPYVYRHGYSHGN